MRQVSETQSVSLESSRAPASCPGKASCGVGIAMGATRKAKSAPGSTAGDKPKWITSKCNTLKEIQSWATDGHEDEAKDLARHSGQLMDNVTEQRMLTSKLWELSKERHKFLTQNSYEKKIFLDRQQRKSSALREMLDGVTPDGRRTGWGEEALRRRANLEEVESTARSIQLDRARCVLVENDVSKSNRRQRNKDWESRHSSCPTPDGQRTLLSLPQVGAPASIVNSHDGNQGKNPRLKGAGSTVFPTETALSQHSGHQCKHSENDKRPKSSYDRMLGTQLQPADHPPTIVRFADHKGTGSNDAAVDEDFIDGAQQRAPSRAWSTAKWGNNTSNGAGRPGTTMSTRSRATTTADHCTSGPFSDPRYLQLRQSLATNYFSSSCNASDGGGKCEAGGGANIARIIRSVEALHKPTRRSRDTHTRTTHRIREFMRERGLQF